MLFNKNNYGTAELKALIGFLWASVNFDNIKTDIMLTEEDIVGYIGQAVYDKAQAHYSSANYESAGEEFKLLNDLVHYIQLPVAYYAYYNFAAHTDISHGEDGRKVTIDNENQKMAWEWMIERDDDATLNKAHKTMDRLIAFLEKNSEEIEEWQDSEAQKAARSLFINTTGDFDKIFPIDNSRRFFIKIIPFLKEAERKHLLPVLGKTRYDAMKAAITSGDLTDAQKSMLAFINVPLAYFSLSIAIKRLSINLMPNGIFQDYTGDRLTQKAKQPAPTDVRKEIGNSLLQDAVFELQNLQKEISKLDAEAANETYVPVDPAGHVKSDTPIFRI